MYGRWRLLKFLPVNNFKVVTITATADSEHPIVPTSYVKAYLEKTKHKQSEYNDLSNDEEDVLPDMTSM
jgi:hypothetical protein